MLTLLEELSPEEAAAKYGKLTSDKEKEYEDFLAARTVGSVLIVGLGDHTLRSARVHLNKAAKKKGWKLEYLAGADGTVKFIIKTAVEPKKRQKKT